MRPQCPFCEIPTERIIDQNDNGAVIRDGYPVSPGHTLVVSKRHVGSLFELSLAEREQLFILVDRTRQVLDEQYHPDAYNIGINDGAAAGQTVPHLHIHLIPRYQGDLEDPRGGVRWVIPSKADYWSA
jgi:diadenosine tetraphosphate (Ap4A) HIT family hydrolase